MNRSRAWTQAAAGAVVILGLGWVLAQPGGWQTDFADTAAPPVNELELPPATGVNDSLALLQNHRAWSARPAIAPGQTAEETKRPPLRGLKKYRLLAIIRSEGREPEVILGDLTAAGETVRSGLKQKIPRTDIIIDSVEGTRVKLRAGEEVRWISLFETADQSERS